VGLLLLLADRFISGMVYLIGGLVGLVLKLFFEIVLHRTDKRDGSKRVQSEVLREKGSTSINSRD